jgi:glucose/arabinose dehydrogenase
MISIRRALPVAVVLAACDENNPTPEPNQAPTVAITSPADGVTLGQGSPITLTASASDSDGSVTGVEFFAGATSLGSDASPPYQAQWNPAVGDHGLTARATDDSGAVTISPTISVTIMSGGGPDTEAPILAFTSPIDGTTGLSGLLSITADASDNVGVAGVRFQVDGVALGLEDTAEPWTATLPSTAVYTSGQHIIRAQARDASGNLSPWIASAVEFSDNATLPAGFVRTPYVSGLPSLATSMAFAPDGRLFIAIQSGELLVFKSGALLAQPFVTVPTTASGERGLLGVAFHPQFATNGWVYVYYTSAVGGAHNRISRFTADGDTALTAETTIADLPNLSSATNHNGGAIHFGSDGKLYAAVGDNANGVLAPDLNSPFGKMLRFNDDGSIPADNPFFNTTTGLNQAIWARGLRNPFTFSFQPGTGRMFINDVGATNWEEINEGTAGANFGWPSTEGATTNPSFTTPVYAYPHPHIGGLVVGNAIVGSAFYNPGTGNFPAEYVGSYFFGDLSNGWIHRLDPAAGNGVYIFAQIPGIQTDLRVGPDGALYSLSDLGPSWGVYRFSFGP